MNAAAEQVMTALEKTPYTADDLKRMLSYREFCDCDVCERIIFRTKTSLKNVYYLKANKKNALRLYIQANWKTIKGMILSGESGSFPPTLAKTINEHIQNTIYSLEADLGAAQDEVEGAEAKIEEYESLRLI